MEMKISNFFPSMIVFFLALIRDESSKLTERVSERKRQKAATSAFRSENENKNPKNKRVRIYEAREKRRCGVALLDISRRSTASHSGRAVRRKKITREES